MDLFLFHFMDHRIDGGTGKLIYKNRVIVMNMGQVDQIDTPQQIYVRPRTRFVADFVGTNNIFQGSIAAVDGDLITVVSRHVRSVIGYRMSPKRGPPVITSTSTPIEVNSRIHAMCRVSPPPR